MKIKIFILILSVIFTGYLLVISIANHYESFIFNPLNSELYYKKGLFDRAVETEPSNAEYHIYHALNLLKTLPKDEFSAKNQLRLAKKEFSRAAKLKPYDKVYQKASNAFISWIDKQL
jgi:hypothetical protein